MQAMPMVPLSYSHITPACLSAIKASLGSPLQEHVLLTVSPTPHATLTYIHTAPKSPSQQGVATAEPVVTAQQGAVVVARQLPSIIIQCTIQQPLYLLPLFVIPLCLQDLFHTLDFHIRGLVYSNSVPSTLGPSLLLFTLLLRFRSLLRALLRTTCVWLLRLGWLVGLRWGLLVLGWLLLLLLLCSVVLLFLSLRHAYACAPSLQPCWYGLRTPLILRTQPRSLLPTGALKQLHVTLTAHQCMHAR